MTLDEVRKEIDLIDPQIRELIMHRLDCSVRVVQAKQASGDLTIYRADREEAILERLGAGVPEDRKAGYLSVVRKIMETSRMYQYGLLYKADPGVFDKLSGGLVLPEHSSYVKIRLTRPNCPNAMSSILAMIGDYGYNMKLMALISENESMNTVTFELTILGDIVEDHMKQLMFQLSMESLDFAMLEVCA